MVMTDIEASVELLDQAFNRGDVEAVLAFYEAGAVVVTEPGKTPRGKPDLRAFFEQAMASGASARQMKTFAIEADGIALFLSKWVLVTKNAEGEAIERRFTATSVLRKQSDGTWRILIDNSFGPLVLGPE